VQSADLTGPVAVAGRPGPRYAIRPRLSLSLLTVQHALIHGQSALYPLVYLAVIDEFGVTAATVVILSTIAGVTTGLAQYSFGALTRVFRRRTLLGGGGLVIGVATAMQAVAGGFGLFAVANVVSRIGGTAIAVHVAGGNIGTVLVGFSAALAIAAVGWRSAVAGLGLMALVVGVAILLLVRERRAQPGAAQAPGPVRSLYRAVLIDRDLRWLYFAAVLGGGSRGLGVLNIFVPLYLDQVVGLDAATIGLMYGVLLAASVPGPLVAGWLSDRIGRRPVIVTVYLGGAVSLVLFVVVGSDPVLLWVAIAALSLFSFVESPQLQALLADITPVPLRDAAFSTYFALAFGVGSMWGLLYGAVISAGDGSGLATVFWLMAGASVAAALATLRVRIPNRLEDGRTPGSAAA
jgi:predicted MFS family arabinose efflux permease